MRTSPTSEHHVVEQPDVVGGARQSADQPGVGGHERKSAGFRQCHVRGVVRGDTVLVGEPQDVDFCRGRLTLLEREVHQNEEDLESIIEFDPATPERLHKSVRALQKEVSCNHLPWEGRIEKLPTSGGRSVTLGLFKHDRQRDTCVDDASLRWEGQRSLHASLG